MPRMPVTALKRCKGELIQTGKVLGEKTTSSVAVVWQSATQDTSSESDIYCVCVLQELSLAENLKEMSGSRTGGHMDILSLHMEKRTAGQGQSQSVCTLAQISLLSQPHAYTHHLMQADGQPALMPSKQRPPMSRGLFSLPPVMLPCNTPGTKSLPSHRWALLYHCTSVL